MSKFEEAFAAVGRLFDEAAFATAAGPTPKAEGTKPRGRPKAAAKKAAAKKAKGNSKDDVRAAIKRVMEKTNGTKEAVEIISQFLDGAEPKVANLSEDDYAGVIEECEAFLDKLQEKATSEEADEDLLG